jgi:hypothetical protein
MNVETITRVRNEADAQAYMDSELCCPCEYGHLDCATTDHGLCCDEVWQTWLSEDEEAS